MFVDFKEVERRMIEEPDIIKRLNDWSVNKPLLITGISGSGKTVCSQEIAKENCAFIVPLDAIHSSLTRSDYAHGVAEVSNWLYRSNYFRCNATVWRNSINEYRLIKTAVMAAYDIAFKDYPYYGLSKDNAFSVSNKNVKEAETNNSAMTLFLISLIDKIQKLNPAHVSHKIIIEGVTIIHLRGFWSTILSYDLPIIVKRGSMVHAMVRACLRDIHNADINEEDDYGIRENLFKQFEIYFNDSGKEKTLCFDKFIKMLETRVVEGKLIEGNKKEN